MPLCDSSKTYARAVWLLPSPADLRPFGGRCLRGLPVLVHEVSSRVWGLRLRRTEQVLALSRLLMLPSAHYKDVGVRISSFRSRIPTPPIPCLRFSVSLAVAVQDSGPSGSLLLSRKALSSSTSCRFIPAHCNGDFTTTTHDPTSPLAWLYFQLVRAVNIFGGASRSLA